MIEKPALVTGGSGFVGRHLVRALFNRGVTDVWVIDNHSTGHHPEKWLGPSWKKQKETGGIARFRNDEKTLHLIDEDALTFFYDQAHKKHTLKLPEFGYVIHLASIVGGRALIEGDPIMVATDLGIDAAFFLWITRNPEKIGHVLYASSSAAYPVHLQGEGDAIALKESHISFDGALGMPDLTYGWSKMTGEYLAHLAHQKYGIRIACVRPFSGYGEDQDLTYPTPSIALRVARGDNPIEVWGTGEQGRDFVHIDDCVDAFFSIMEKVSDGSGVNIGTGTPTSFNELIKTMLKLEGRTAKIKPLGDMPIGVATRYADVSHLTHHVGWKPKISLEDGLRRVLEGAHERLNGNDLPFSL